MDAGRTDVEKMNGVDIDRVDIEIVKHPSIGDNLQRSAAARQVAVTKNAIT